MQNCFLDRSKNYSCPHRTQTPPNKPNETHLHTSAFNLNNEILYFIPGRYWIGENILAIFVISIAPAQAKNNGDS